MRTQTAYCNGKVRYDKKGATTAKNKRYHEDHIELRIYSCDDCLGWHLTSREDYFDTEKPDRFKKRHQ